MFVISACLTGERCRYSGDGFDDYPELRQLVANGRAISVCPEALGGAPVPRDPCEIKGGDGFDVLDGRARVFTKHGKDITEVFIKGAREVLVAARRFGARTAVLKERSPSCGSSLIYDGSFTGKGVPGCGCTAAILIRAGFDVYSEENFRQKSCLGKK